MRNILSIILLSISFYAAHAQNYQCVLPSEKQYFINSNNYLRGMRIDSFRTSGDTTFYYPFHTLRGRLSTSTRLDANGASWMGSEVIMLNDGRYWFFNKWGDTVEIRSQAQLNDKWVIHHDTNDIYYEAEITAIDTATVMGVVDSIKTIAITGYDKNGLNTTAPINGLKYVLSKKHGFYKVVDIYFFPYHHPGDFSKAVELYEDYYTYKIGGFGYFYLIDFKNPMRVEMFQYKVGDIFFTLDEPTGQHMGIARDIYYYDSVAAINTIPTGKEYIINRTAHYPVFPPSGPPPLIITYDTVYSTYKIVADSTAFIAEFPEEPRNEYIYYYYPNDTSYCTNADLYKLETDDVVAGKVNIWLDISVGTLKYKAPIGLLYHNVWKVFAARFETFIRTLKYYRIDNKNCGGYSFPSTIKNTPKDLSISIYPNPANDGYVYIDVPRGNDRVYRLTVYDAVGKKNMTKDILLSSKVDVSNLTAGVYSFIITVGGERVVKKITIY